MSANPLPILTAEAYLAIDRAAEWKSEFHDGEMFPMEAVSLNHAAISVNLAAAVGSRLRSVGCRALGAPLRVRVSPAQYVYPDLQIVRGKAELTDEHADTITNPKVVIEIQSPSTTGYDHGPKFDLYRRLPTVEEYVLISQSEPSVEIFSKRAEKSWWLTIIDNPEQPVRLQSVGIEFPLGELYDGIEFG